MAIVPADHNSPSKQTPKSPASVKAAPVSVNAGSAGDKAAAVVSGSRLVQPEVRSGEAHIETGLRPRRLSQYLGQEELKQNLGIAVEAARRRGDALDHMLFYGPPGLGKTTISMLIAEEMGTEIRITSAPALERPRDIAGLLVSLQPGDILFIDEIHRLNKVAEEILYPAMEDFMLDITIGKGQAARIKRLPLKRFTLIGATTKAGSISSPLRTRFGHVHRLRFYSDTEMQQILLQSAVVLGAKLGPEGAMAIACRSRGTPRVGNRLLKWVRDFAEVRNQPEIDAELATAALDLRRIDAAGLDPADRQILETIIVHYQGGPVGIETLAAAISEDTATIEDMYEPFLMQRGFLQRTSRGRVATPLAWKHLGMEPPSQQLPLFD
ncbi:MAG: Holliday junction branch migration DNA helicase RuvB [Candidatus Melainabacteria bacterium HGW-Melainabacteria-1]|nr:MAG: Holliday junction branch migration DNA helicase RuvB [Candidatus Melainabacteria bacterium HGW-Melainabacteria-1]